MSKMVDNNEPNKLHECSTEERTTFLGEKDFSRPQHMLWDVVENTHVNSFSMLWHDVDCDCEYGGTEEDR